MADVLKPNSIEAQLVVFLRAQAGRKFDWPYWNCGLWLADWIAYSRGIDDPAKEWRGAYHDEESCRTYLNGLPFPVLVGRLARRCGLKSTRNPSIGDIAVIMTNDQAVGAIKTARGWAVVAPHGIVRLPEEQRILGAWEACDAADNLSSDG